MSDKVAIRVTNLSKVFKLPQERLTSVKSMLINFGRGRSYETQKVLDNISFEIKEGEFFGIVGRNGSGKSTLLKILAEIYTPSSGQLEVNGKLTPFIELGVGFNPELTGRENVYLNGALLGFSREEMRAMYKDIVDFAGLENFMDQKLKNYSSGMEVRLAFSVAIRARSDILLIDEVLAVGDADFQHKCYNYFHQLKKEKRTVVFVTHDMAAVVEYCDRAMLINNHTISSIGSPQEIAKNYTRLFDFEGTEGIPLTKDSSSHNRWGDKTASVEEVVVPKLLKPRGEEFAIKVKVKFNKPVSDPVFGFVVKTSTGQHLTGTNTKIKQVTTGELKAGEIRNIEWKLPNVFADAHYYVDATVQHSDGITVCDWREDIAEFEVRSSEDPVPYDLSPPITVKLS